MSKKLTASELTKMMIEYLSNQDCEVWRNNNLAVKGRAFIGRKGVPDIIGYDKKEGRFVACEIKAIGDKLSQAQVDFLTELGESDGVALAVSQSNDLRIMMAHYHFGLILFYEYNEKTKKFKTISE